MKTVKRALALVLALTLLLAMNATVFAADDTYTITISGDNVVAGHTYEAYQIFKGDLAEKDSKTILSNITWGNGITEAGKTALGNAAEKAETLKTADDAAAFAKAVALYLQNPTTSVDGTGKYTISGLKAGYYLVKDTQAPADDFYSAYIMEVVSNVEAEPKGDKPTVDKNIKDDGETTKVNEASIGDTINYEVTSKVPDMTGYTKYFFVLNDTMSKGLTFNNDVAVTIGGTTLGANKYTVAYNTDTTGITTIEIVIKNFINYTKGDAILVTYSATLNQDASLDPVAGNPNKVQLTYSNNPNVDGNGDPQNPDKPGEGAPTDKTPESETKTYVTGIKLTKVDGADHNKMLTGAKFKIEGNGVKVVLVNKEVYEETSDGTYYMLKTGTYTETAPIDETASSYDSTTTKYKKVTAVTKDTVNTKVNATGYVDEKGVLTFEGLGEGTYTIKEIVAPNGYNLLKAPIKVEIKANATFAKCEWTVTADGKPVTADNNLYAFLIENKSGAELPSTGGIGTTVFYVLGGLLVVCAGVLLITKRRMNKNA